MTGPRKSTFDVRAAIQTSAIELWQTTGFDDVSVAEICGSAGVTQAAFFYHYGSMSGLVSAVFRQELSANRLLDVVAISNQNTWELTESLINAGMADFSQYKQNLVKSAIRMAMFEPDLWGDYDGVAKVADLVLRRGQARGDVRTDIDIEMASRSIVALLLGVFVEWSMDQFSEPVDIECRSRLEVLFEGLRPITG